MKLLIVESPAKAKTINKYLGSDYKVISSYGHIRALPSEEGAVDPDNNFAMHYHIIPKSQRHVDEMVRNAKKADSIMLATDPDREGEAISWHIYQVLQERNAIPPKVGVKRVVFYEITKKAVLDAVAHPRELNVDLVYAQQARQALDYLVGFTLSPVLWRKLPGSRSAGRVQSVSLRMICEREAEIERFVSKEYWTIHANCLNIKQQPFMAILHSVDGRKLQKFSITNANQAEDLKKEISDLSYKVVKVDKKVNVRKPSPPFTTSTMLQEASRKLGFSAKRSAQVAQKLYEGVSVAGETVGLITYMRTDSVSISVEAVEAAKKFIGAQYGESYLPKTPRLYRTRTKNPQEAHEAIRPTNIDLTPEVVAQYLDRDLLRLYELIWKRMTASQMSDAQIAAVAVDISDHEGKAVFRATGSTIMFDGFLKIYKEDSDDGEEEQEATLPPLNENDFIAISEVQPKQHFTQPPPRFSEASLVRHMEELGIGRPSTYPTVISILQDREYVVLDRKRFIPQAKGRIVSAFLTAFFERYVEYSFTADLEDNLDNVSNGTQTMLQVLQDFWGPFKKLTEKTLEIKNQDIIPEIEKLLTAYLFPESLEPGNLEHRACPSCKTGTLGLKTGRFGSFVGCSNYPSCNYMRSLGSAADGADGEKSATDSEGQDASSPQLPRTIGTDPESGDEISLRKGPYGFYLQRGDGKTSKRAGLPKGASLEVDLPYALRLLSMPLVLGEDPVSMQPVKVGIGKFGPYLERGGKYTSLKTYSPMEVTIEQALQVLQEAASKPARVLRYKKKPTP